jgi:hypothetical protein
LKEKGIKIKPKPMKKTSGTEKQGFALVSASPMIKRETGLASFIIPGGVIKDDASSVVAMTEKGC